MRFKILYTCIPLWLLALSGWLFAQDTVGAPDKPVTIEVADEPAFILQGTRFTLGDAIRLVLEKNRDTLSGAYDVAMTDSPHRKHQAKYSPSLNLEGGGGYTEYPTDMGVTVPNNEKTWDVSAALAKMFSSGTTVSAGVKHVYNKSDLRPIVIPSLGSFSLSSGEYNKPVAFVSVQQELLRNAFGYNDRRQEEMLRNTAKMQRETIIYRLSGLVVGAVVEYWSVVTSGSALENARLELQETRRVRDITAANVRLGLVDAYEMNFYNRLVVAAEAKTVATEQQYRDALRSLLATVDLPEGSEVSDTAVLSDTLPALDIQTSLETAYEKRADYQAAVLTLANARKQLEINENNALPRVIAELNISSLAQRLEASPAYNDVAAGKYPSADARIKVTYPLNDIGQETDERDARYGVEQARIQLEKYRRTVRDDVSRSIGHVETYHLMYLKAKEGRVQAEAYYRGLLNNLRRGRLGASVVKEGLLAMVESRQQEREALITFNLALLQMEVAKNSLFERYSIDVEKYIPGK